MGTSLEGVLDVGFVKLKGLDFEFYMQNYSIMLGRDTKNSSVDIDLFSIGGGRDISRHHAHIFYDFDHHHFAMEVLSMKGCVVQGILYPPGGPPVKLNSQDHIHIGKLKFYFLLPTKGIAFHPKQHSTTSTINTKEEGVVGGDNIDVSSPTKMLRCEEAKHEKRLKEENTKIGDNDNKCEEAKHEKRLKEENTKIGDNDNK